MAQIPDNATPALDMLRSVGGDAMLAMMLQTFVQFADERIPQIAAEAAAGRLREAASGAHALKASARQLGALALGDALAMVLLEERGFTRDDFAQFHPAGNIGALLLKVKDIMRTADRLPIAPDMPGRFSVQIDAADLIALSDEQMHMTYKARMPDGSIIQGRTDPQGLPTRLTSPHAGIVKVLLGDDDWAMHIDSDEPIGN